MGAAGKNDEGNSKREGQRDGRNSVRFDTELRWRDFGCGRGDLLLPSL
jgi:hypothetical protein